MVVFVESDAEHDARDRWDMLQQHGYFVKQPTNHVVKKNSDRHPDEIEPHLSQSFHVGVTLKMMGRLVSKICYDEKSEQITR